MLCDVCARTPAPCLVPERADAEPTEGGRCETDGVRYHYCTVCLDAMLSVFPISPRELARRELTGRALRPRACAHRFRLPDGACQ